MRKARIILGILCMVTVIGGGIYYQRTKKQIDTESPVLRAETDEITVSILDAEQELLSNLSAVDNKDGDV